MRVTILSRTDYAGSAFRIVDYLKDKIDIEIITKKKGNGNSRFGILEPKTVDQLGKEYVRNRINTSDIIHFKGDWLIGEAWEGFRLPQAKKIYTFSGSFFRRDREKCVAMPVAKVSDYKADILSAFTPELCYNQHIYLMEFPYNKFDYHFKKGKKFRIMHIPSHSQRKGSDLVMKALTLIKRNDVEFITKTGIKHTEVMDLKKSCHIYIDQLVLPVYGNAGVEALAMGIPILNWDENYYPYKTPVIKPFDKTPEMIALEIEKYLNWERLEKLSLESFDYAKKIHGTVCDRWLTTYKNLYASKKTI
jgi:hypothetical protein